MCPSTSALHDMITRALRHLNNLFIQLSCSLFNDPPPPTQDVVEIMREALYNRFTDDLACIDFRSEGGRGGGGRAGSKASEAKRFLTSLRYEPSVSEGALLMGCAYQLRVEDHIKPSW